MGITLEILQHVTVELAGDAQLHKRSRLYCTLGKGGQVHITIFVTGSARTPYVSAFLISFILIVKGMTS